MRPFLYAKHTTENMNIIYRFGGIRRLFARTRECMVIMTDRQTNRSHEPFLTFLEDI